MKNRIYEIDSIDGENSEELSPSPLREGEDNLAMNNHMGISPKANLDLIMHDSLSQKRTIYKNNSKKTTTLDINTDSKLDNDIKPNQSKS